MTALARREEREARENGMNRDEASRVAESFRQLGGFSSVRVEQVGGEFALPTNPWTVELWSVNARAGNRNLTVIREVPANLAEAKRLARQAQGKATARDKAALARIAAEKEMEKE